MPYAVDVLSRRAAHVTVGAEDAAVTRLRAQYGVTVGTLVEVDARVHRHRLTTGGPAMWASDRRHQERRSHSASLWPGTLQATRCVRQIGRGHSATSAGGLSHMPNLAIDFSPATNERGLTPGVGALDTWRTDVVNL